MRLVLVVLFASACGRIGIEERRVADAADNPSDSSTGDAPPATCPNGTTKTKATSSVCIEKAQRGNMTWTESKAICEGLGRRLCADLEWFTACENASGLTDMTGDDYEWVAEESGGIGQKRGASDCQDMSSHEIFTDPYGFRCCVDL